ncbi:hypothetical protein Aple_041300 [Acrocarpospora pleiomorpha]|uniref:Tc1-like transposase DDE domain-containing protein n=1 Tax=Acrocarpospora pleiomorpha TaxID=90975 RepID=A0A5M3XJ01_9ACTN|nr:hypothetical protein Aple_041300 [Acrocarpospora pleiomorpha]
MVVWDQLNAHVCAEMRAFIDDHDWLTVFQLPSYTPELSPTEGIWANLKGHLANLAVQGGVDHLAAIKHHLKRLRYWLQPARRHHCPDRTHPRTRTAPTNEKSAFHGL